MEEHPDVELLLHPECGCVSSCMAKAADGTLPQDRTFFLSTEGMLKHIAQSPAKEFAVGTELGIMHRLRNPFNVTSATRQTAAITSATSENTG